MTAKRLSTAGRVGSPMALYGLIVITQKIGA
jgi:hypothetical protein